MRRWRVPALVWLRRPYPPDLPPPGAAGVTDWTNAHSYVEVVEQVGPRARGGSLYVIRRPTPSRTPPPAPQNYTSLAQVYSRLVLTVQATRDPSFFVSE